MWAAIYEKAAVIASGQSYAQFAGGDPAKEYEQITGQAGTQATLPSTPDDLTAATQKSGQGVVITTAAKEKVLPTLTPQGNGVYAIPGTPYTITMGGQNGGQYQIKDTSSGNSWTIPNQHCMPVAAVHQTASGTTVDLENPDENNANNPNGAHIMGVPYVALQALGGTTTSCPWSREAAVCVAGGRSPHALGDGQTTGRPDPCLSLAVTLRSAGNASSPAQGKQQQAPLANYWGAPQSTHTAMRAISSAESVSPMGMDPFCTTWRISSLPANTDA